MIRIPLLVLTLFVVAAAITDVGSPRVGRAAPNFEFKSADGKTLSLSGLKGHVVVLEWFNNGCPFVRKFYGSGTMQKLQDQATSQGVIWLTICSSAPGKQGYLTPGDVDKIRTELGMRSTALLLDPSGIVGRSYQARTTPDMFVIDQNGVLVYKGAIDDQPTPDPASLANAKNYVEAALASLHDGKPVSPSDTRSYGCGVKYY
jgi:peroxiredoxin